MGLKNYIEKNYEDETRQALLNEWRAHKSLLKGNFYAWENEYLDLGYHQQQTLSIVAFIQRKIERIIENAQHLREEENQTLQEKEQDLPN
ncbi:hypothetical protein [Vagococcus intermedius]|uniref:Uncharacterized protein n=1 Tax=Vagococcus intermedius TaxID=2991418 RepID=A0AAF0I6F8_9ENTE|nr:hypothetical protein [Vagococcus intermedius]WEG73558.1 hypothetical protein OL234_01225 [Vagococcus intermedius]WEG75640.1 hypothetical protein OL235_01230 [Vagococcus intermedius]